MAKSKKIQKKSSNRRYVPNIKNTTLIQRIEKNPLYNKSNRDDSARKQIENIINDDKKIRIFPGQLVLFKYFEPKTKEELKYYDASPCTIFFGIVNTTEGKRVLGFNIHYYPSYIRYKVMNRIFQLYKNIYIAEHNKLNTTLDLNYKELINKLKKAKLDFGVRMYIPQLITDVKIIPPDYWDIACFTEGWFKKVTKEAILNYWRNWK